MKIVLLTTLIAATIFVVRHEQQYSLENLQMLSQHEQLNSLDHMQRQHKQQQAWQQTQRKPATAVIYEPILVDFLHEYEMTSRNGTEADKYARAALVAESYLKLQNDEEYERWVKIRDAHYRKIGEEIYKGL